MKLLKLLFVFSMAFFYQVTVFAGQTAEGNWITVDENTGDRRAVINFAVKDGVMYGTIAETYPRPGDTGFCSNCPGEFKGKPIKGLKIAWGLKEKGNGEWVDGRILDAKTGRIYRLKLSLKGDRLYVRGYYGISLLGRTQVWERV
jgi:uncharacterized protein (DUF2147 family)